MFDLGFGHPTAIRRAFLDTYNGDPIIFTQTQLDQFDYSNREGDQEIIALTRQVIKRQLGLEYKHVLLTNGATGGVVIALRAYSQIGRHTCITRKPPYYLRYPGMISAAGMTHKSGIPDGDDNVHLLDIPSNPIGLLDNPISVVNDPIILDSVYLNNVYTEGNPKAPPHDILVGSYSKLLGLSGLRIGWIATNNDFVYERMKELVISEYLGLCTAGSMILKNITKDFNWETFETKARTNLNFNRGEWQKLERYFEAEVPAVGMFFYSKMDSACKKLMEKSEIKWTPGSVLGTDDSYGRFNLGQDCELTSNAVKQILKNDGL